MCIFHPGNIHWGFFLLHCPEVTTFFTWAHEEEVLVGMSLSGPDMVPGTLGEVGLDATSIKAVGTDRVPVPLDVGFSGSLGLMEVTG